MRARKSGNVHMPVSGEELDFGARLRGAKTDCEKQQRYDVFLARRPATTAFYRVVPPLKPDNPASNIPDTPVSHC